MDEHPSHLGGMTLRCTFCTAAAHGGDLFDGTLFLWLFPLPLSLPIGVISHFFPLILLKYPIFRVFLSEPTLSLWE